MQKSNKQKKKKSDSKNNSNHSSSNNSNTSDENKNSLNNSGNISKEKNIITNSQQEQQELSIKSNQPEHKTEKLNQLKNLKYIFPFFTEIKQEDNKTKNYSISEYNKIVSSINKNNKISDKNNYEEDILKGKINIIDKIIQKYMPTSNDNKVIQIHQGLTSLSLKIDKNFNMLNDIGYRLPNLISLDLSGSEIESIMDIGTSFNKLEKLNVSNCGLSDLNGIICFNNLKELIASNNKITDLIYIEMCEELKIIDLSYNLIEDENNLLFLNSCPNLQKVILTGNKIKNCGKNLLDKNIQLVI